MKTILIVGLSLVVLSACDADTQDSPSLGTLEADRIELIADSAEPITAIHVSEGDRVKTGDVLVEQDPARASARLEKTRSDLAVARAKLAEAETGPRAEDIRAARARLSAAEAATETAKLEWQREQSLLGSNYTTRNRVDVLKGRYDEALAQRNAAEATLEELEAGTRSEQIDAARNAYEAARANFDDAKLTLGRTSIRAPVSGSVEALPFEIGERPPAGQTVVTLIDDARVYARVHVPEPLRTRIHPGTAAEIRIDGHETPYRGKVRWIAREASFTPYFSLTQHDRSHLSYLAEVDLVDERADQLPIGLPVQVYFPEP
jgi:HlyD family secretion protein